MPRPLTGRPIGRPSKNIAPVLAAVANAGEAGISTADLRRSLPEIESGCCRGTVLRLTKSGALQLVKGPGKVSMLFAADVPKRAIARRMAAVFAAAKEARKAAAARRLAELAAVRAEQREQQSRERAEHRAAVARAVEERRAQAETEKSRRATLTAARKAETALNNRLAKKIKGTTSGIVPADEKPGPTIIWPEVVQIQRAPRPLGRWEVDSVPRMFSALPPGQYLSEAA